MKQYKSTRKRLLVIGLSIALILSPFVGLIAADYLDNGQHVSSLPTGSWEYIEKRNGDTFLITDRDNTDDIAFINPDGSVIRRDDAFPTGGTAYGITNAEDGNVTISYQNAAYSVKTDPTDNFNATFGNGVGETASSVEDTAYYDNRVYMLSESDNTVYEFTNLGVPTGNSWSVGAGGPRGFDVNSSGYFFVSDWDNSEIRIYDNSFSLVSTESLTAPSFPQDIHIGASNYYVLDDSDNTVYVYDSSWLNTDSHTLSGFSGLIKGITNDGSGGFYVISDSGEIRQYDNGFSFVSSDSVSFSSLKYGDTWIRGAYQADGGKWYVAYDGSSPKIEVFDNQYNYLGERYSAPFQIQDITFKDGKWYIAENHGAVTSTHSSGDGAERIHVYNSLSELPANNTARSFNLRLQNPSDFANNIIFDRSRDLWFVSTDRNPDYSGSSDNEYIEVYTDDWDFVKSHDVSSNPAEAVYELNDVIYGVSLNGNVYKYNSDFSVDQSWNIGGSLGAISRHNGDWYILDIQSDEVKVYNDTFGLQSTESVSGLTNPQGLMRHNNSWYMIDHANGNIHEVYDNFTSKQTVQTAPNRETDKLPQAGHTGLTNGPDNTIWVSEQDWGVTAYNDSFGELTRPHGLVAEPLAHDMSVTETGDIWFTDEDTGTVYRFNESGYYAGLTETSREAPANNIRSVAEANNQLYGITTSDLYVWGEIADEDYGIPNDQQLTNELLLIIQNWMDHGAEQSYTVEAFVNGQYIDVTDSAVVTSSNSSVVTVGSANNRLIATSDTGVSQQIEITADYGGQTASENVTVANRTISNIDIMPPSQWLNSALGCDDPQAEWCMGSPIQWTLLAVFIGSAAAWKTRNEWVGIGVITGVLILFWTLEHIGLGIMLVGLFYAIYVGYQLVQTPSRSDTKVGAGMDNFP